MRFGQTLRTSLSGIAAFGFFATVCAAGYYFGRVIDKNNAPVQGVAVSFDIQKLSTTTDAQGKFTLGVVSAQSKSSMPVSRPSFTLAGSRLFFNNCPVQSPITVRCFSMQGRLLRAFAVHGDRQAVSAIDLTDALSSAGDGCYVLQVGFNNDRETVYLNRVNGMMYKTNKVGSLPAGKDGFALQKTAAIIDTINLSKTSFLVNRISIADTASNLGDLKLYPLVTGTLSKFMGFDRYDFQVSQKNCIVVVPKKPAAGNPWVWRSYFFDHKPRVDSILCAKGYYMGYIDLPNLYGCPTAVTGMTALYSYLTASYGLSKKPLLIGISRGGLYIYNWARSNLAKVSCLYGDGACMDIIAWPCACYPQGGTPSASDWATCKTVYGFANDSIAKAYTGNPYQNMRPFAEAKIPLIHVYGTADPAAIPSLNVLRANDSLKKYNWNMVLIAKPGIGHVHGVTAGDGALPGQSDTLVNFLLKNTFF
jgi:hypothetical protein